MSRPVEKLLRHLEDVCSAGSGWSARCPAHDDESPSLSIGLGKDGRVLVHCHAGCQTEDVMYALGLQMKDLFPSETGGSLRPGSYTLHQYAVEKRLPEEFLRSLGVRTHEEEGKPACVTIPYLDRDGQPTRTRFRTQEHFWWGPGEGLIPYGLDRLASAARDEPLVLVEGESDAQTLWLHGFHALGIPGATTWKPEWAECLGDRRVFVWMEPDSGGRALLRAVKRDVQGVKVLEAPDEAKDPSDLHQQDPDAFHATFSELMTDATPASEVALDPKSSVSLGSTQARARIVRLEDVKPERVRWLWYPRIPLGKLTILEGDPGQGKSTLMIDLAARVSTNREMPDGERPSLDRPRGVVLLTAEDGLADTVRPRLDAVEADCSRIVALRAVVGDDERERWPNVRDVDALEETVERVDARLLVLDPLVAYLGDADAHRDQDVRSALADLAEMADRLGVAVVAIRHLRKSRAERAIYRGGGSIAFTAAARSVLLVGHDPDDPTGERRGLAPVKSNLCRPAAALAFALHEIGGASTIVWEGEVDLTAEDLLGTPTSRDRPALEEAMEFLSQELAEGPEPARDLRNRAEGELAISFDTLKRAKRELGIRSVKKEFGDEGWWAWELPRDAS